MKKLLSSILAVGMIAASVSPVLAKDTDEMQSVLSGIKGRIPDTEEFEDFTSESHSSNNREYYSFSWNDNDDGKYRSMNLSTSKSGIISQYHYYDEDIYGRRRNDTPSINRLSQDEALEKTKELVKKLNPEIYSSLKIEKRDGYESLFDSTYNFMIKRYENEIPVYQDTGYVTVNSDASQIIDFSMNYTEGLTLADVSDILNASKAWVSFMDNAGMELQYRSYYKDDKESISAVYVPLIDSDQYINAETGKLEDIIRIYDRGYNRYSGGGAVAENAAADMASAKQALTKRELEEIDKVAGLLSEEEAEKIVRNIKDLDFDSAMKMTGINLYKHWGKEEYFYNMTFSLETDDIYKYGRATVNAKTGELINWYTNVEDSEKKIDREEFVKTADEILTRLAPKHFGDNKDYMHEKEEENDNVSSSRYITYTRYINGVKFNEDMVNIRINPENNKVVNYSITYTDAEFPSVENVISAEEASKKLSEQAKLTLYYIPTISDPENSKVYDTAVLGYMIDDVYACVLDADTGKIKKEETVSEEPLVYTDIDGHYAKEAINTLAKFGIGFESGEYKPDEIITQQEFAALLVSTFVNNTPIILRNSAAVKGYYNQAINREIIKDGDGNPEDALTREKAAVYMVRAMDAEKYAELSGIYRQIFPDVTDNIGYIGILAGMKVFNGDENGNFNPKKNLSRADAAMIIYNYLTK